MADTRLTDRARSIIARAREIAELPADGNCAWAGEEDADFARGVVLGHAKHLLGELAAIAERLGAEDTTGSGPEMVPPEVLGD